MPPIIEISDQENLVLTKNYSHAKFNFEYFNKIQSRLYEIYDKDINCIVATPTGSGKTITAEMFLAHEIRQRGGKGLYLAPLKSLTKEKIDDWTNKNHHFGDLKIAICSGDYRLTGERKKELEEANLIVMTTEMLSARCVNFKSEHNEFLKSIGTIVVDECFPAHTKVLVDNNIEFDIERICKNDDIQYVLSYEFETGKFIKKRIIKRIIKKYEQDFVRIKHECGKFTCTSNHKIWTQRGYVKAKDLLNTDIIKWIPLDKNLKCNICGKQYNCKKALNSHYIYGHLSPGKNAVHTNKVKLCEKCNKEISVYGFLSHVGSCDGSGQKPKRKYLYIPKSPVCKICGKIFPSAVERARHEITHRSPEFYKEIVKKRSKNPKYIESMKLMGEKRRGKNNPIFRNPDTIKKISEGHMRWRNSLSEEEKQARINIFINAPLKKTYLTKLEVLFEEYVNGFPIIRTSGGKRWVKFKNGKSKNPDFTVENTNKVIEVGDIEYWHTKEEIQDVVEQYKKINIQCLYLTNKDIAQGKEYIRNIVNIFINNHDSKIISVAKYGNSGIKEVYDLEIEDTHSYFANGVLVSNCHIIGMNNRGNHAEVGLMKFSKLVPQCRIIGLSATLPNVKEICEWISYSLNGKETYLMQSKWRPIPLLVHYETYLEDKNYKINEQAKIDAAMSILKNYPQDKFLVFSHSIDTGLMMLKSLKNSGIDSDFHYSDLPMNKRDKLESKFKDDPNFRVLVATSTLAWGCFKHGSIVPTVDGPKLIENINIGDFVYAYDGKSFVPKKVVRVGDKKEKSYFKVTANTTCCVNKDHIFYSAIKRDKPQWNNVSGIQKGDFLAGIDYSFYSAKNIKFNSHAYLIGYVLGDGCLVECGKFKDGVSKLLLDISCGQKDIEHLNFIKKLLEKESKKNIPKIKSDINGVLHIQSKCRAVVDLFRFYVPVGRKKNITILPFLNNFSYLKGVIQGLMDSDGGFVDHKNGNFSIEFTSIHESLIKEIQQVLILFGIKSSFGKKRIFDNIIHGHIAVAKRDYIYRLRIYNNNVIKFQKEIGFVIKRKAVLAKKVSIKSGFNCNDLIPVRTVLDEHAIANETTSYKMVKNSSFSIRKRCEPTRKRISKLVKKFTKRSLINDLLESPISWQRVKNIEEIKEEAIFRDIEVEDLHNYIGGGFISHNCNLPARRVIILGVNRGLDEVHNYDIFQEIGRSGRPGFDSRGDAYVLLPDTNFDFYKKRLLMPQKARSQLLEIKNNQYKTLAFHVVSEIDKGVIKNNDDMYRWYSSTLAAFQANDLEDEIIENVIKLLVGCKAIKITDGQYSTTPIGKIASMFYFSPLDVSDLKKNFDYLFEHGMENDNYWLSTALGNIDSNRSGIVSKSEKEEIDIYARKIELKKAFSGKINAAGIKTSYVYYLLLNRHTNEKFSAVTRNLLADFSRLNQVITVLDSMAGKWNKKLFFEEMGIRILYQVSKELIPLCKIPNIGATRAQKLFNSGLKTPKDVADNPGMIKSILNISDEKALEYSKNASKLK